MDVLLAEKQRNEEEIEDFMEKITKMKLESQHSGKERGARKKEVDQMIGSEWTKLKKRKDEVNDILDCWKHRDQPLIDFLTDAIAKKEEDLRCPVCLEVAVVFSTCERQHIICDSCFFKLDNLKCPECRVKLPKDPRKDRFADKMVGEYKNFLQRRDNLIELGRFKEPQVQRSLNYKL